MSNSLVLKMYVDKSDYWDYISENKVISDDLYCSDIKDEGDDYTIAVYAEDLSFAYLVGNSACYNIAKGAEILDRSLREDE
ncbi:hypothetical protein Bp8pC_030 [Bacillus phage Bp8p-C]|uniref:Uncharacterized protein n=2 Tax=Agatevirus Bp8pC TaxID=1910937 RepID=A0A0A0PUM1_9CAUD|nr:hypothetical protein AXJ20_gp030 [Bacillus phage Bp8p-C]YP_009784331.1 hypothetical protein QLX39_gp030 [Bacillus phage Bp8p-T]AHJ87461.1 hypothetical protein Bp8pC_030 [Bacillus phage Bp8p-C]AHJ87672.1 hypothetical protein Bp8pT_030 [Bacillus phage Bp8p-T]